MPYEIRLTEEVDTWLDELADTDLPAYRLAVEYINMLEKNGPGLGRPTSARSMTVASPT